VYNLLNLVVNMILMKYN